MCCNKITCTASSGRLGNQTRAVTCFSSGENKEVKCKHAQCLKLKMHLDCRPLLIESKGFSYCQLVQYKRFLWIIRPSLWILSHSFKSVYLPGTIFSRVIIHTCTSLYFQQKSLRVQNLEATRTFCYNL